MVERDADGDLREPMLKGCAAIEAFEGAPGFEKGLLREVFELLVVAFIAVKNPVDLRLMAADEFGEVVHRAISDSGQQ